MSLLDLIYELRDFGWLKGAKRCPRIFGVDVLSDVLVAVRTGSPRAARTTSHAPWGVRFSGMGMVACHVVLAGDCWLLSDYGEPLALSAGDVLFIPHRDDYALVDQLGSPIVNYKP